MYWEPVTVLFQVTPVLGVICTIMIWVVVKEPPRGAAEGGTHLHSTSWFADLKYLLRHRTFMLSTAGFTCVAFVAGALALWTPTYIYYSIQVQAIEDGHDEAWVSLIFGIVTCISGFTGVGMGSALAAMLRKKWSNADPLVCAAGLIASAPFLFLSIYMSRHSIIATWVSPNAPSLISSPLLTYPSPHHRCLSLLVRRYYHWTGP